MKAYYYSRDAILEVRQVCKRFHIYENQASSIREVFIRTLSRRKTDVKKPEFFLQKVSISIAAGETWALIGPNGAGKSTLLRLMAGIYWPTDGEVIASGRLAALIELAAGFHPELTGMDNVYLYGSILGLTRSEISEIYGEIVEFAGIEDFMDTPVKYYSSGMRMRLGFAVATAVKPEILLLDEILAIGDAEFHHRCLERIRSFQSSGCTIVIATHDLERAEDFVTHAAWLDRGQIQKQGLAKDVISAYRASFQG